MGYPSDVRYTREHEWARMENGLITVGITSYATEQLGDVVFVELPGLDPVAFCSALDARGVKANEIAGRVRLVTHADVDRPALARAVEIIAEVVGTGSTVPP